MKNVIKLTSVMLFVCSPLLSFSQEEGEIDTRIDNWRYWREKAELGIVPFNPDVEALPAIEHGPFIETSSGLVNSPDVVLVTGSGISQSENSVFVNPNNNQIALNGNNSFGMSPTGANAIFTFDGGLTWTGGPAAPLSGNMGDPAAAVGLDGTSYMGHISAGFNQGVDISTNNGATWSASSIATSSALLDKNHLWIDNSPGSPHEGNLYSAWTQIGGGGTGNNQIVISRSTNNGATWSTPLSISNAVSAGSHNQGVNIQTGPNGEVYAVWAIYDAWPGVENAIGFSVSTNGGVTFSPAVRIHNNIKGIRYQPGAGLTNATGKNMRQNSFPGMTVDISGGANDGDIYVTWTNVGTPGINTGSDVSVWMIKSTNGGSSWSSPSRINQDPVGNHQYFPWIACDPVSGALHTVFYDDRNVTGAQVETWVASSTDGGSTWTDFRVSDVAFTPAPIPGLAGGYMGDYLGIAARGGQVYPVWTDNRTGQTLAYTSPFSIGCAPNLTITANVGSSGVDHQEADFTITASNSIASGGEAIYHAGDEVLMIDGFTAVSGSIYRAYIEGCSGSFVQTPVGGSSGEVDTEYIKAPKPRMVDYYKEKETSIELTVFPNPTSDIFSVKLSNDAVIDDFKVNIYSMSAGMVYSQQFLGRNTNGFQVDISEFTPGVYFIELIDVNSEKVYSGKVIKK